MPLTISSTEYGLHESSLPLRPLALLLVMATGAFSSKNNQSVRVPPVQVVSFISAQDETVG